VGHGNLSCGRTKSFFFALGPLVKQTTDGAMDGEQLIKPPEPLRGSMPERSEFGLSSFPSVPLPERTRLRWTIDGPRPGHQALCSAFFSRPHSVLSTESKALFHLQESVPPHSAHHGARATLYSAFEHLSWRPPGEQSEGISPFLNLRVAYNALPVTRVVWRSA